MLQDPCRGYTTLSPVCPDVSAIRNTGPAARLLASGRITCVECMACSLSDTNCTCVIVHYMLGQCTCMCAVLEARPSLGGVSGSFDVVAMGAVGWVYVIGL